jgi:hypothetical protein
MLDDLLNLEDWEFVLPKTSLDTVWYASVGSTDKDAHGVYCVSRDDLSFVIVGDSEAEALEQVEVANKLAEGPGVSGVTIKTTTWMSLCSKWRGILYKGKIRLAISGLDWIPTSTLMSPGGIIAPDPYMMLAYMDCDGTPVVDTDGNLVVGGHPAEVINELHDQGYAGEVWDSGEFRLSSLMDLSLNHKMVNYAGTVYNTRDILARNPKFVRDLLGDKEEELIQLLNLKKGVDNEN